MINHQRNMLIKVIIVVLYIVLLSSGAYAKDEVIIFHAGSLSIPFMEMEKEFEHRYPGIDVIREASGSVTAARKVTDLGKECDVIASADYTVIEQIMIPEYADFSISFATNEMAIMFSEHSKYKNEINPDNWYKILLRDDVEYGHSDPNADPCGYRTLLLWQLAQSHYAVNGLYDMLMNACPLKNIRPKETDLISLLEAGELDYIFIYRSVAQQHKAPFIELPDEINLKSAAYNRFYKEASVSIKGKKPGEYITQQGQAMIYGITIPKNAPHYDNALKFLLFVLSSDGRKIMEDNGQSSIIPAVSYQYQMLPEVLRDTVAGAGK